MVADAETNEVLGVVDHFGRNLSWHLTGLSSGAANTRNWLYFVKAGATRRSICFIERSMLAGGSVRLLNDSTAMGS
jgi:hypothetical protein